MVAFSYTRAASDREISKAVDQAIEQTLGTSQDQVVQQTRTTNELIRQLNQSRSNLGQETYDTYRSRLEAYKQNLDAEYDRVVQAQQNTNIQAANQSATRDIPIAIDTKRVNFVSEDFTAATAEQSEQMAKENLAAQAKIQFGDEFNLQNYNIRTRFLNDDTGATIGYTSFVTADGSGSVESNPNPPVTPDEIERLITDPPPDIDPPNIPVVPEINIAKDEDKPRPEDDKPWVIEVSGTNDPINGPNRLHEYSTYTYGISLHYMTIKEYNAFVTGKVQYSPKKNRVLIASGGRRNEELARNPNFNTDMYITDFKMVTVIGSNPTTKGTNAVTIEFTINEPISATLIERLVALAQENDIQNWIEMPLVLQIDFFATNPDGTYAPTPIPDVTKYACIKLTYLTFEISNKGAEYKCTAIPQSHQAYNKNSVIVPANFEVTSKTIGEFFAVNNNPIPVDIEGFNNTREVREADTAGTVQSNSFKVLSFADALNEYQRALAKPIKGKKYQEFADEYNFEIDPEIASASLTIPMKHDLANSPMQNESNNKDTVDKDRISIPINAGSNILEVINQQIRNSSLYRNQIKADKATGEPKSNNPLRLHHITSKIEYTDEWDSIRKVYRRKITYIISKFDFHNHVYPNADLSIPKRVHKYYNYLYTGKNQDIRDFKIQFNTLWFAALTNFENRFEKDNLNIVEDPLSYSEGVDLSGLRARAPVKPKEKNKEVFPRRVFTHSVTTATQQQSDGSKKSNQAVDLWNSVFNYKGGDMITLNLEIAGDPDFIKQDDVWYPSNSVSARDDSGIRTDRHQIYIMVNFQLRDDIDLSTGLYIKSDVNSAFAGVYSVHMVENFFKDGAFYQRLICTRLFGQEDKFLGQNRNNQVAEGTRTSTDEGGLEVSTSEYEADLEEAGLRAFEERESATQYSYYSGDVENNDPSVNTAFSEYKDWATVDVTDPNDYPGG